MHGYVVHTVQFRLENKYKKCKKGERLNVALHMVLISIKRQANILVEEN
jgi:hypothetical protein